MTPRFVRTGLGEAQGISTRRAGTALGLNPQRFRLRDDTRERIAFADALLDDSALRVMRSGKRFVGRLLAGRDADDALMLT